MRPRAAAILVLAVWSVLLLGRAIEPRVGRDAALLGSFGLATALVLAARPAGRCRPRSRCAEAWILGAGALAGWAAYPVLLLSIVALGAAVGLPPPRIEVARPGPAAVIAVVVLAPVFEELLYRGCVLGALRGRCPVALAIGLSSALFAASHLAPWGVLGAFVVGFVLGAIQSVARWVGLTVGMHAGLNIGGLLGAPASVHLFRVALAIAALGLAFQLLARHHAIRHSTGIHSTGV